MALSLIRAGKKKATGDRWLFLNDLAGVSVNLVPRRGLEPPRCYSLVPETSASTNSAIWASYLPKLLCIASQRRLRSYSKNEALFAKLGFDAKIFVRISDVQAQLAHAARSIAFRAAMKKATGDRWLQSDDLVKVCLNLVPRRGLEPPRCYSLVPETSASTNSAIWAHMTAEAAMF